jgi:hypothetical protein
MRVRSLLILGTMVLGVMLLVHDQATFSAMDRCS